MEAILGTYDQLLDDDLRLALSEGGRYFENESEVHKALRKVVCLLGELGIEKVLAGALAICIHGYRRITHDVNLIVTREGSERIHSALKRLSYIRLITGRKALRDAQSRVKIDFLTTGDYPGDGKPASVAFPNPLDVANDLDGHKVIQLAKLIELKLASGKLKAR
ncbi:hypothetical protein [Adhaeretor mobilis]|uniref:Uncharacterized protein n=1 Tax=Adhaeretor mobilis TaxID=1930276 RepID=A0A517MUW0_9BACT|nr:hypothetical protein [Adhaeretor mobilis]QDS98671.1 hypothetical protein HG15A2_19520 [Adhaeretor mobilis]